MSLRNDNFARDSLESYNEGMRAIGERVKAGAPVPEFDLEAARTLTSAEEQDLIRRIVAFPDMLAAAALAYEPHRVAFYLQETIAAFHSYYTQGKRTGERVISADARTPAVWRLPPRFRSLMLNVKS